MAIVKTLSFISHSTVVLATQITRPTQFFFNTIHHCVTEDKHKSHYGFCVKAANKKHKV